MGRALRKLPEMFWMMKKSRMKLTAMKACGTPWRRCTATTTSTTPCWEWAASPSLWLYSASVEPRRKTSVCVFIIFLLQIAALVFINIEDENINIIRQSLDKELAKGDLDLSKFEAVGSKFTQNLFFGVSAGLSAFVFLLTVSLCCRTRREERVQAYIEAERA